MLEGAVTYNAPNNKTGGHVLKYKRNIVLQGQGQCLNSSYTYMVILQICLKKGQ